LSKSPQTTSKKSGKIHIGIGGWTFAPWRGVFYPEKLTQARELEYAASIILLLERTIANAHLVASSKTYNVRGFGIGFANLQHTNEYLSGRF
jgi:hypothetical protein